MKKFIVLIAIVFALMACGKSTTTVSNVDSTKVDTTKVDSVKVDTIVIDTVKK